MAACRIGPGPRFPVRSINDSSRLGSSRSTGCSGASSARRTAMKSCAFPPKYRAIMSLRHPETSANVSSADGGVDGEDPGRPAVVRQLAPLEGTYGLDGQGTVQD